MWLEFDDGDDGGQRLKKGVIRVDADGGGPPSSFQQAKAKQSTLGRPVDSSKGSGGDARRGSARWRAAMALG